MIKITGLITTAILVFFYDCVTAQKDNSSVSLEVHYSTTWTKIDDKRIFFYELTVKNNSGDTLKLQKLSVLGSKTGSSYVNLSDSKLSAALNSRNENINDLLLSPGGFTYIYIEFETDSSKDLEFKNRLDYVRLYDSKPAIGNSTVVVYRPSSPPAVVLGSPFKTGLWTAVYDPAWKSGHRRVFYADRQKVFLPGRYAIDFIRVDSLGKYAAGNADSLKAWFGFRNEVVAVADGVVASVMDCFPESATLSEHTDQLPENASGNYVSLKIGAGKYVFYEHLSPKSICVKPGQKIRKGETIGRLGFSGQTTDPHLHFHLADRDNRLHAEGLPFVFAGFKMHGRYLGLKTFGKAKWQINQVGSFTQERPPSNSVIEFESNQ